jgi:two-component system, cell cycle response regulator
MHAAGAIPNRVVLVVEDAEDCSATLDIALHSIGGLSVCFASSAEEALGFMDRQPVSALITDLHLPAMDGFEFLARVRGQSRYASIPILVISGDADPQTPKRALSLGANVFFGKPYSPIAVRQKLEELIHAS